MIEDKDVPEDVEPADEVERGERLLAKVNKGDSAARKELQALFARLQELATAGRPDAQALVGGIRLEVFSDTAKALHWFEQAAAAGNPAGLRGLASMLGNGRGVEQDLPRALSLFELAAEHGDKIALFNLGRMYLRGVGVEQDGERGLDYMRRAAEAGFPAAAALYGHTLAAYGRNKEAAHYYRFAAEAGMPDAIKGLADACRDGLFGPVDFVEAVRWYLKMLDFGDADGIHEALQLVPSMTHEDIRRAAELADRIPEGEALIETRDRQPRND